MRKSQFTESQILAVLKEGEAGVPVAQIMRKHGISQATYYNWKSKYGGASAAELKRLKELDRENAKLKRMYADLALENAASKEELTRKHERRLPGARRPGSWSKTWGCRWFAPVQASGCRGRRITGRSRTGIEMWRSWQPSTRSLRWSCAGD